MVLLQGAEHAGRHGVQVAGKYFWLNLHIFVLQVLAGEPEQARLAVLGGDEARALLGDGGPAVGHGLDPGRLRDGLLQGHQERGGRRQASAGDHKFGLNTYCTP